MEYANFRKRLSIVDALTWEPYGREMDPFTTNNISGTDKAEPLFAGAVNFF